MRQAELEQMPIAEKFQMMEQLWDSMSQDAYANGFTPDWHVEVLNERASKIAMGQLAFSDISDVKKRLQTLVDED